MILLSIAILLVTGKIPSQRLQIKEELPNTIQIKRYPKASWPNGIFCKITGLKILHAWQIYLINLS
jgi:hypothetical protein